MTANGTDDAATGLAAGLGIVFIIIFAVIGLILYILPGIIASMRRHPQALPIWLVTIFLGGTGIGWIAAFIWAFIKPQPPTVSVTMAMPAQPYPPQNYAPVAAPGPAPAPVAPTQSATMIDEIGALARLRDQGVLTEAEFTARKHLLLGEGAPMATAAPAPVAAPIATHVADPAPAPIAAAAPEPLPPEAPHAPVVAPAQVVATAPTAATAPEPLRASSPPPADAL